jgi:LacI family transcriptional regulator
MQKAPTVYDVAERAGVSIATVSRVFRRPDVVKEKTRKQVMDAVAHLGYVPSGSARGLADRRTGVLGLLLPSHDQPRESKAKLLPPDGHIELVVDRDDRDEPTPHNLYYDEVLLGAESEAWAEGFALMVTAGAGRRPIDLADIVGRIDGLIAVAHAVPEATLEHAARRVPVVLLAEAPDESPFDHVSASNREGMRALVRHVLTTHGARRLAFIAGPADSPDAAERESGAREAIAEVTDPVELSVLPGEFERPAGRRAAIRLLDGPLPDAVICANDQTALGVLEVFARRGIRVPADVIVTGFDGIDAASATEPRLTTVKQPMFGLGAESIRALIERLSGEREHPRAVRLAVEVVLRESCGCGRLLG